MFKNQLNINAFNDVFGIKQELFKKKLSFKLRECYKLLINIVH